jgi:ATP-dependent helicase/nuclease subunit A
VSLDQKSRDVARKHLDTNIVVEAGAGTGKTTLLTDRILFLLLAGGPERTGLSITRIVALTFTEKAAGEIKMRLAERLHDLLRRLEGPALPDPRWARTDYWLREARDEFGARDERLRAMAEEALRELDRANLGTIHSFCKTLLQLFPLEAGINPSFQMDKGDAFNELFGLEWGKWLEQELGLGGTTETLWREILPHVGLGDLSALARALARLTPFNEDPHQRTERLRVLREGLERLPEDKPKPRRGKMLESIQRVSERLEVLERVVRDPWAPLPDPDEWKEDPKKWPQEWEAFDGESIYEEACALAKTVSPIGEAVLARARKLLVPFVKNLRARYHAAGWMGFDDLLRGARDLLAHHPEVRRDLKGRFGAVLVDEFQDTDPLQGEMLLFLSERPESEASEWHEVFLAPGKLFIVGDPKQSIYRFRGADIRAYEAFVALVIAQGGQKCDLLTSFRTHAGIVDPVNRLFTSLMQEVPGLQPAYLPLHPRPGEAGSGGIELALVPDGTGGPDDHSPSARSGKESEAHWMAHWIVTHCGPEGSDRPWRLGDVALLFRSTSALTIHMEALKAAQIPYRVESDRAFYSTPEVVDFLNLLRILQDPSDRVSLVGLLRSPLILLEDREILLLAETDCLHDRHPLRETLPDDLKRRVAEFYGMLGGLRDVAQRVSLGELAAHLLRDTPLLATAAVAYHGEQSVSNLYKMARLATEASRSRGESLAGFTRRLSTAVGGGVDEGENPLGEEKADAVRLLTVHKAKGLEYKVVFVPNLGASVQGGNRKPPAVRQDWAERRSGYRLINKKWADVGMAFLETDERRREREESVRLFYVAATRAREHVILLGNEKAARGSFMEMLKNASVPGEGSWGLSGGFQLPVTRVTAEGPSLQWAAKKSKGKSLLTAELIQKWDERIRAGASIQNTPLFQSPSTAAHESEKPLWADAEASPILREEASLFGRLVHRVLELWPWEGSASVSDFVNQAVDPLMSEYPRAHWSQLREEANQILAQFLSSPVGQSIRKENILAREAPFLYPSSGVTVRGVIDLLYRRDGLLWVADFKTDRIKPGDAAARAQHYAPQGHFYREAVQRSLGESCGFEILFLRLSERVILP